MEIIDFALSSSIETIKELLNSQDTRKLSFISYCKIIELETMNGIDWPYIGEKYIFILIERTKEIHFTCTHDRQGNADDKLIKNHFRKMILNDDKNYVMNYSDQQLLIKSSNFFVRPVVEFYSVLLLKNILPPQICRRKGWNRQRIAVINLN